VHGISKTVLWFFLKHARRLGNQRKSPACDDVGQALWRSLVSAAEIAEPDWERDGIWMESIEGEVFFHMSVLDGDVPYCRPKG
jgi:hypothetical protein